MPPKKKAPLPTWLKDKDLLNPKHGRDKLVDRLRAAAEFVSDFNPDASVAPLDLIAQLAIDPKITRHKDKEVRVYAACVLADIMRTYAPDAPYEGETIKEICALFAAQLQGLADTQNQMYAQYYYLLERLSMTHCFTVLLDLEVGGDNIVVSLFETFFNVVSDQHNRRTKTFMIDIMETLVEELGPGEQVPQPWLDVILAQLIEPQKQDAPWAYDLAKQLLESEGVCAMLTPAVSTFMKDSIVSHKGTDSELSDRTYDIILELNRMQPQMLLEVLPHLVEELKVDDVDVRLRCVKLLLQMFTEPGSTLLDQYEPLFAELLGRYNDSAPEIRVIMVDKSPDVLKYHRARFQKLIEEHLRNRIADADDGVRASAVTAICTAAMHSPDSVDDKLLTLVGGRILDKKTIVQVAARNNMIKFYREHAAVTGGAERYKWIPSRLLAFYAECASREQAKGSDSKVVQLAVLKVFATELIPQGGGRESSKRMMAMHATFSKREEKLFFNMVGEQIKFQTYFDNLAKARASMKSSQDPDQIDKHVDVVSRYFQEPRKAQELLKTLTSIKSPRVFKLLNELKRADITHTSLETAESELRKLLVREVKGGTKDTLDLLLHMLKMDIVGRDKMMTIMSLLASGHSKAYAFKGDESDDMDEDEDESATEYTNETLLNFCQHVANVLPDAFKGCFTALHSLITNMKKEDRASLFSDVDDSAIPVERVFALLTKTGHLFATQPMTKLRPLVRKMATYALDPTAGEVAVRAISAIGLSTKSDDTVAAANAEAVEMVEEIVTDLAEKLTDSLISSSPVKKKSMAAGSKGSKQEDGDTNDNMIGSLGALCTIAETHPLIFAEHVDAIQDFVVNRVLGVGKKGRAQKSAVFSTEVKVAGLKVLTAQLLGLQDDEESHATSMAACKPVWKLLTKLVDKQGDVSDQYDEPETDEDCATLRLNAGRCMLKLLRSRNPDYEKAICGTKPGETTKPDQALEAFALLTEDSLLHVRKEFTTSLFETLQTFKPHHLKYFGLFAMISGFTEDVELKKKANSIYNWGLKTRSEQLLRSNLRAEAKLAHSPEAVLPYLVPLVAHSRSFEEEAARSPPYKGVVAVFKEFFDPLLDRDSANMGYMLNCLNMIRKCTEDALVEDSEPLYIVAEIALAVLRAMTSGRHYNITHSVVSLPLYFYAKPEGQIMDITRLPSSIKLPTKTGMANANRKPVANKTPVVATGSNVSPSETGVGGQTKKKGGTKRFSTGGKLKVGSTAKKNKKSSFKAPVDSESESEEDDDELFGSGKAKGKGKGKGKAKGKGRASKGTVKAAPKRKSMRRAAKTLQPMLSGSQRGTSDDFECVTQPIPTTLISRDASF